MRSEYSEQMRRVLEFLEQIDTSADTFLEKIFILYQRFLTVEVFC